MEKLDEQKHLTESADETHGLAEQWSDDWDSSTTLGLVGPLGSGKTTFLRGLVEALSSTEQRVRSPSYTLLNLYDETDPPIAHADLYRTSGYREQETIGLEEYFGRRLVVIEWADRWAGRWPENTETIRFEHDEPERRIVYRSSGPPG